ncbi:WD repeat and SOCS box-containing protein 1 [Nematostella vectensis]|uniref:WD repeat and SOCS box-containing protein 1 n=1 Tax=Nematostella vectensis TaxID=45351 RepID=UPI0020777C9E|nr:WD repeat and SOCS box-containing protein 1 [Nematostella vectensis]
MSSDMGCKCSKDFAGHLPKVVYRPLRPHGASIPPPFTVIHRLKHVGPLGFEQPFRISACCFIPDDDNMLITLSTLSVQDAARPFRAGFVQSWDLQDTESGHDDSLFTYSPKPTLSVSPDGGLVGAILNSGRRQLIIAERDKECTLEPCKIECVSRTGDENLSARTACCVFAPCGTIAVTVSNVTLSVTRGTEINEICLWRVDGRTFQSRWKSSCEVILPNFSGSLLSLVFSPDSSLIALSTSHGQLYVIRSSNLEICQTLKHDRSVGESCFCQFDPRFAFNKLTACFSNGTFKVWRLDEDNHICMKSRNISEDSCKITSFSYCPDGTLIAFGLSNGTVHVYDTEFYKFLYIVNQDQYVIPRAGRGLSVCSVSFPKTCQQIAVGYNNSYVCIWQLPVKMELQHLCRIVINQLVPANRIHELPLPKSLKAYLLYTFLNLDEREVTECQTSSQQ